jgi:excisionase family DNA binding protein
MTDPEFLTSDQVASRLLVGPHAVRHWLRTGRLRGVKLPGGDWRIRPKDVELMLRSAKVVDKILAGIATEGGG